MASTPNNYPHRRAGQLYFLILPLLLLSGAGTRAAADSTTSYSSHCPSPAPAPDHHTDDVGEDAELLLKPFQLFTGFFSGTGAKSLFNPNADDGRYFSFLCHSVSRTTEPALLHLTATLTLVGDRVEEHNTSSKGTYVAISFHLDGYYSSATSELCMVGTGTEPAGDTDRPVKHYAEVAVHLRVTSRPSLTDPFVNGRLEGANFETISLVAFAEGDDIYEYSSRASCPPAAAMPTARRAIQPQQHDGFSCAALRAELMYKYGLTYGRRHAPSNSSPLPQLQERVMTVNEVRCAGNGAVRLYAVFSSDTSLWSLTDTYRFQVAEQAVVADGFWDSETRRLCLHACLVARSASRSGSSAAENLEVRECGIGMSFWFPAVWTVRDRSATVGMVWNASQTASAGGNSQAGGVISDDQTTASSFEYLIKTANLSEVKYSYNQTLVQTAMQHYRKSSSSDKKIKGGLIPGNYKNNYSWYRDLKFHFFTNNEREPVWGQAYPVSIGPAVVDGDELAAAYSFSQYTEAQIKQSRLVNVSYALLFPNASADWPEIRAEGVYDTETGFLSMVGCRELTSVWTTDCRVLITVQFPPLEESSAATGFWRGKGRITSLRDDIDDVLYFETRNVTLFGSYNRRDREVSGGSTLASSALSSAFAVVLMILHFKRNRDDGVARATSKKRTVPAVLVVVGYAVLLALDLDALLASSGGSKLFVQLSGIGLVPRAFELITSALQLGLLQLAWARRQTTDPHQWSAAERRVLLVCLPLYLIGAAVVHKGNISVAAAHMVGPMVGRSGRGGPGTTTWWGALAGLLTDGFLLPQAVLNAISPWFYVSGTVIRVAPHLYDLVRGARHDVPMTARPLLYVDANARPFGSSDAAWDAVVTCGARAVAAVAAVYAASVWWRCSKHQSQGATR